MLQEPCIERKDLDSPFKMDQISTVTNNDKGIKMCKTIRRRGNIYKINESRIKEENGIDIMIHDLYEETLKMSAQANKRAIIYKYFVIICSFFVIIAGAIIGVLTIEQYTNTVSKYITAILGFIITIIKTLIATFSLEKRSVLLKEISSRLRKLSREIRSLETSQLKYKKKRQLLEGYYIEVDELDLNIFDNNITSSSTSKVSTIIVGNDSSHSKESKDAKDHDTSFQESSFRDKFTNLTFRTNRNYKRDDAILPTTIKDFNPDDYHEYNNKMTISSIFPSGNQPK